MGYGMAIQEQFQVEKAAAAEAIKQVLRKIEGAALQQSDIAFSLQEEHMLLVPISMAAIVELSMHDVALTDNLRELVATSVIERLKDLRITINEEIQAFEASLGAK